MRIATGHGLSPIDRPRRLRKIITFDFEWYPGTYEVRIIGVFDGTKYRAYYNVDEFLNALLVHRNEGAWIFAHWGGTSDTLFLPKYFRKHTDYNVRLILNGSSANIIKIKKGNSTWNIIDSAWLMRTSLAEVGEWLGMKKGGDANLSWETESLIELIKYNKIDCEILWKAIKMFEEVFWSYGGELCMTIASTGMNLFRRRFLGSRIHTAKSINKFSDESYFASRVEVFRKFLSTGYCFDINSSFPYAMTFPHPGNPLSPRRNIPNSGLYTARVKVRVPEMYLPPLPVRKGFRIFFPVGEWIGVYNNVDLELLLEMGGSIEQVFDVQPYTSEIYLRDYAGVLWQERKKAIAEGKLLESIVLKFLLNACYGKFAETEDKEEICLHTDIEYCEKHWFEKDNGLVCREHKTVDCSICYSTCRCYSLLFPGCMKQKKQVDVAHRHVPIASHITSIARRTLYKYLIHAVENGGTPAYCDTDSIFASQKLWGDSKELGEMKIEYEIKDMMFIAPKIYGGKFAEGAPLLKAKGFSLGKKIYRPEYGPKFDEKSGKKAIKTYDDSACQNFANLLEGGHIQVNRMIRLREMLDNARRFPEQRDNLHPKDIKMAKRLSLLDRPKREYQPDGDSRPWTFKEVMTDYKTNKRKKKVKSAPTLD